MVLAGGRKVGGKSLCVCVCLCGWEAQKVFCVRHTSTPTRTQENKQNLYSLNRMTLYKFSCAPQWGCVYVC